MDACTSVSHFAVNLRLHFQRGRFPEIISAQLTAFPWIISGPNSGINPPAKPIARTAKDRRMPLAISPFIGPTISPPIGSQVLPAVQLTQNGVARNRLHCTDSVARFTFRTC